MGKTTMIVIVFVSLLCTTLSAPAGKLDLRTYSFTTVLLRDEVIHFEKIVIERTQGLLAYGIGLLYAFNVTSRNITTRTINFNITWRKLFLDQYGDPVDVGKFAIDIHGYLIRYKFHPSKFRVNAAPAPPVSLKAKDVSKHGMTIAWEHPKYFDIDSYQMEMKNGSLNDTWRNITELNGTTTMFKLDELQKDSTYKFRIGSKNKYGNGELKSKVLVARTKGDAEGMTDSKKVTIIVVVVVFVVIVLVVVAVFGFYWRRNQNILAAKKANPYEESLPGVLPLNIYIKDNKTYCTTGETNQATNEEEETSYFSWNEIPRDELIMDNVLGEGEFGIVQKATWINEENEHVDVAVKSVKNIATNEDRVELFKELKLMAELEDHPNIVNLVGACCHRGPLWVVVEFCENGNLLRYLKDNRKDIAGNDQPFISSLVPSTRLKFAYDVSKGMSYLEGKKVVHRDLAARNVLLGENNIAKVSDFGLSRDIYEIGLYQKTTGGKLPVKWMAIESLQEAIYTSKSDVWSFGVLFWEIETAGMLPYGGITGYELGGILQRGHRLSKPPITSPEIYDLMQSCWELNPADRLSFQQIESKLESELEQNLNYLEVLNEPESERPSENTSPRYENYIMPIENEDS